jgi:GMP synthase-like glutamine amidotransferase
MTRILVVEHEADAGIGLVGERIARAGAELAVVGPDTGRDVPRSVEGYDGVVVLGGSPSPTDESVTWFGDVRGLVRDCLDREVPLLGICLGAQLLGLVAGGRTDLVSGGPEIGVCTLRPTAAAQGDPLLGDLPAQTRSLQWHFYEVRELPPGSTSLVVSDRCVHQAFRVGRYAWALQFHLEALPYTVEAWSRGEDELLGASGLTGPGLVSQMREAEPELRATWSPVADRWLEVVDDRAAGTQDAATAGGSLRT